MYLCMLPSSVVVLSITGVNNIQFNSKDNNIKLIRIHYKLPENEFEPKLKEALNSSEQQIFIGPY